MLAEHIRLETKQVVATALAQRMITPPQAEIVMTHAADYERRGVAHMNVLDLMVSLNMLTPAQAAQLKQIHDSTAAQQTFMIGKYMLTNRLGAGAMGTVYLAVDQTLQRKVALKILSPQLAALPEFVGRFKKEARVTAQLSHRNIVHVHDVDELDGFLFYAMEYLDGQGLDALVAQRGKLPPAEALQYTIQAAKGLEAAHKLKIIHRDVKPANLFLTSDNTIKLVDLGLSKDVSDKKAGEHTMTGMAIGTPHYIAPEQARGLEGIDGRADIYGLGCTLYMLLTGTTPYSGPNPLAIMNKQINEPPPDPRKRVASLPAAYTVLIELMMAKNPNDRYQTCTELIADLERVLAGKAPMGASVTLADEGGGDVPAIKRRAVGGKRGSSGPITSVGRGTRPASALLLEAPRSDGSSGFRRASAVVAPRRATERLDRVEVAPLEEDEKVDPWYRKYALHLGAGGGILLVVLVLVWTIVATQPPPKQPRPTAHQPPKPQPLQPPATPGSTMPPPPTPPRPATPTTPPALTPYEQYKQDHPDGRPPTPTPAPVAVPAPTPPRTTPAVPGKPASYTLPPAGYEVMHYEDAGQTQPAGEWHRMTAQTEGGIQFFRWTGVKVPGVPDVQWPFFEFVPDFSIRGELLIRARVRRNGKNTDTLRFIMYSQPLPITRVFTESATLSSREANRWVDLSVTGSIDDQAAINQYEFRAPNLGVIGETIDVEWLEIARRVEAKPAPQPVTPASGAVGDAGDALQRSPLSNALLQTNCNLVREGGFQWMRCTAMTEGETAFVRWVFAGNELPGTGQIKAPSIVNTNPVAWGDIAKLTVRMRVRGHGQPRFNMGLKLYYSNTKNPKMMSTDRIDLPRDTWGEWIERTVEVEVNAHCQLMEVELRPYDTEVAGGAVDIDWLEIVPAN